MEDSKIISQMISEDFDSIPCTKNQVNYEENQLIEDDIIINGLKELYKAIYNDHNLKTKSKIGLSANILNKINEKLK